MHRHFIAGALVCFGSSLFGQSTESVANQAQGTLNNAQNTIQNGQTIQDRVDRNVQQSTNSSVSGDASTRSSLNTQNQAAGTQGLSGSAGVQSKTNLQNDVDAKSGQLNSNLNTQVQGQTTLDGQQLGNNAQQNPANQRGNNYQSNGDGGFQSQSNARQAQPMQPGQASSQGWSAGGNQSNGTMQNGFMQNGFMQNGTMQNGTTNQSGGFVPYTNMQQSWTSQNAGRVYVLRFDASGREFICVDGRPVYFDNVNSLSAQGNVNSQNQYRAGYGNYDSINGQNFQNSSGVRNSQQPQPQSTQAAPNLQRDWQNSRNVEPSSSTETTKADDATSLERDRFDAGRTSESSEQKTGIDSRLDVKSKTDVAKPNATETDSFSPKP